MPPTPPNTPPTDPRRCVLGRPAPDHPATATGRPPSQAAVSTPQPQAHAGLTQVLCRLHTSCTLLDIMAAELDGLEWKSYLASAPAARFPLAAVTGRVLADRDLLAGLLTRMRLKAERADTAPTPRKPAPAR